MEEEQGFLPKARARHAAGSLAQGARAGPESQDTDTHRQIQSKLPLATGTWQISDLSFLIYKVEIILVLQSVHEE